MQNGYMNNDNNNMNNNNMNNNFAPNDNMQNEGKNFEQSLADLQNIVNMLEHGDLSLEESMQKYEMGVNLTNSLNQKIANSKLKVKELRGNNE